MMRVSPFRFVLTACGLVLAAAAGATEYYVDAGRGDDANSGLTRRQAWRTLEKVNGTVFQPGDCIRFAAGCRWEGQLHPQGSGAEDRPILIDRYGRGPRPVIDAGASVGRGVLHLHNQSFWEVNALELTSDAEEEGDRRGVMISAANAGLVRHVHLKDLYIHHIRGIVGHGGAAKDTGGIGIFLKADNEQDTRYDDVLVENCRVESVDNTGIFTSSNAAGDNATTGPNWERRRFTNLRVRGNRVNDIGKNAIIIRMADAAVVEHNVCWDTADRAGTGNTYFTKSCRGAVFQYNEGYLNRSHDFDGSMYDADTDSPGCIFQYSYSHDNTHGLFWTCTNRTDANIIVRYNVSQNDRGIIFCVNFPVESLHIYNNVVYVPEHLSPVIIDERRLANKTWTFRNNIIYNLSRTATYNWKNGHRTIEGNVFHGFHPMNEPADPAKVTADPRFVDPGSAGIGLNTLGGYRLRADSPCIDTGLAVEGNGGQDLWGNPLPAGGGIDRGAHERPVRPGLSAAR